MPWLYLNQETWNTFNTCNRKGEIQQFQGYEVTDIYLCRESLLITGVIFVNKYLENTRVKSNKILIQDLLTYISISNVLVQTCWSGATTAKIWNMRNFWQFFSSPKIEDEIYQTRERVFHRDIQIPKRELKIRRTVDSSYFWRNSRCLDNRWKTFSSVW